MTNFFDHPTSGSINASPAPAPAASADFDFDRAATALFGNASPAQRTAPAPDTRPVAELSEAEVADRLFKTGDPALNHSDGMRAIEQAAMHDFLASPEEASQAAEHWGGVFQAVGLSASESAQLADIGIATFTTPATPELRTSWVEQSQQALLQDFGPQGARAALDDARRFVAIHAGPDLREVLDSTGLGDHPHVVRLIAAKARAARIAGKLKG